MADGANDADETLTMRPASVLTPDTRKNLASLRPGRLHRAITTIALISLGCTGSGRDVSGKPASPQDLTKDVAQDGMKDVTTDVPGLSEAASDPGAADLPVRSDAPAPRHSVFSLADNRLLAHLRLDGGLLLLACSAGFAKYTSVSPPTETWSLRHLVRIEPIPAVTG